MRRADRLFQIIQLLRRGRVVTAATLAREVEVSERTIYRDIRDLIGSGVPIEGEAGVGYLLPRGFDLPPLMFTREEIETLVLGARMVETYGGSAMARRARSLLGKVEAVLPPALRRRLDDVELFVPDYHLPRRIAANVDPLRQAASERRRVHFSYERRDGELSIRTVRPLGLYFWGRVWTLVAWCELREDFRNFRSDRISDLEVMDEVYPDEPGKDLATFLKQVREGWW